MTADPNETAAVDGQDDPFAAEQAALRATERERLRATERERLRATERERLRATERERLRALREADMAVAERLHADDYQLIPPTGETWSKREYLDAIASHQLTYLVFEPISPVAARVSDQMAAVRYRAKFEVRSASGATDAGTFWHTDIYEKRDGHWQAVWSQATRIPPDD